MITEGKLILKLNIKADVYFSESNYWILWGNHFKCFSTIMQFNTMYTGQIIERYELDE